MHMLKIALSAGFLMGVGVIGTAYAVNLPSENSNELVLHSTLRSVTGENSGLAAPIGEVQPGATFTITGECVARVKSADNLRVVLTFADSEAIQPGYRSLVATDQQINSGGLSVRVPDLPEAANRIFSVKVFHLGQDAPEICDAGSIRIGATSHGKLG
jgi:hypothetical protein